MGCRWGIPCPFAMLLFAAAARCLQEQHARMPEPAGRRQSQVRMTSRTPHAACLNETRRWRQGLHRARRAGRATPGRSGAFLREGAKTMKNLEDKEIVALQIALAVAAQDGHDERVMLAEFLREKGIKYEQLEAACDNILSSLAKRSLLHRLRSDKQRAT